VDRPAETLVDASVAPPAPGLDADLVPMIIFYSDGATYMSTTFSSQTG
jgi:hypothetical protein